MYFNVLKKIIFITRSKTIVNQIIKNSNTTCAKAVVLKE